MKNTFVTDKILSSFKTGWEFEFFVDLREKDLVKGLKTALGKDIFVPRVVTKLDTKEMIVHNHEANPTDTKFKLERDYSGGPDMWELITGPMTYEESRIILVKFYAWLREYGYTNDRCSNHMNISIDKKKSDIKGEVMNIDRLKMCLSFDEEFVYSRYPNRRNNVYARSMKTIYPYNKYSFTDNIKIISGTSYKVPNTKYYGINFIKLEKNYLEFRYIGGKDYEYKIQDALECHKHFCSSIYENLVNPEYNESDVNQLNTILSKHKKIVNNLSLYEYFILEYKKIKILIDLSGEEQIIKSRWHEIKDVIYDLIVLGKMSEGYINLDTIVGKYQVKDAILTDFNSINSYEIINSRMNGLFYKCDFYHCTIKNSQLFDSDIVKGNLIENSKIMNTPIKYSNKVINSYIDNKNVMVNGNIENSIIRNGAISQMAMIDKKTLII